jgi:hypothetical protein
MRKLHSLVLASLVLASSAIATVTQVSAAPLSAPATTTFMSSETIEDVTGVTTLDDNGIATQATTYAELDATAGVSTTIDTDSPIVYPAVNPYQYSDDNS